MTLKLHPLAEDDFKTALDYYHTISPKLEKKFFSSIDKLFSSILEHPNMYQHEGNTSQKVVMSKFPYIIIYEQYENIIMILAIFHTKQDPQRLSDRN